MESLARECQTLINGKMAVKTIECPHCGKRFDFKSIAAQLGHRSKGVAKTITLKEREARRQRMAEARAKRWVKSKQEGSGQT
ncbi:MAG: hypothetical protein PHV34_19235 [Verrucomicrobiae bacterium]|nr:hypothetical protein [Verrucomicrobiae bacterium]